MIIRSTTRRRGISLIETIACVAIVATLSTGMVGVMRSSARVAAHANGVSGGPATARSTLRILSNHVRDSKIDASQPVRSRRLQLTTGTESFEIRASQDGTGRDLIHIDASGNETTRVSRWARAFEITRLDANGAIAGLQLRLVLEAPADIAAKLRPNDRVADVSTTICVSPQL